MKKSFVFLSLILIAISLYSQKITKEDMSSFKQEWKSYVDSCAHDSTLYVFWEYTGKEKKETAIDTIEGKPARVVTIVPTQKMNWVKETPNMDGFERYINRKNKEDGDKK